MLQDDVLDSKLIPENIDGAIASLSEADLLRLHKAAKYLSFSSRYNPEELLNQAIFKALDGVRQYKPEVDLVTFLFMTMKSLVSSDCKSQSRHPELSLDAKKQNRERTFLEDMQDPHLSPEHIAESIENLSRIKQTVLGLFNDNLEVQTVVEGIMEEVSPREIQEVTGLDKKGYASARRLMRRRVDKAFPEGWKDE